MLKKFFISLSIVLSLSFTSCGGGSSDEAKELLSKILQFVGIPHNIIVNVCQDENRNGVCGPKEIFTKLTIKKGESVSDILRKISLTADGRYFLETYDPTLPILVELHDPENIKYDNGNFTLKFNGFENNEQNEIKEISAIQSLEDAGYLTAEETKALKALDNREAVDRVIFDSLENNYNLLRDEKLNSQVAVDRGLKSVALGLQTLDIQKELPSKLATCADDNSCIKEIVTTTSKELNITKEEAEVIADEVKIEKRPKSQKNIADGYIAHLPSPIEAKCSDGSHFTTTVGLKGAILFDTELDDKCEIIVPSSAIIDSNNNGVYDKNSDKAVGFTMRGLSDGTFITPLTTLLLIKESRGENVTTFKTMVKDFNPVSSASAVGLYTGEKKNRVQKLMLLMEVLKTAMKEGADVSSIDLAQILSNIPFKDMDLDKLLGGVSDIMKSKIMDSLKLSGVADLISQLDTFDGSKVNLNTLMVNVSDGGIGVDDALEVARKVAVDVVTPTPISTPTPTPTANYNRYYSFFRKDGIKVQFNFEFPMNNVSSDNEILNFDPKDFKATRIEDETDVTTDIKVLIYHNGINVAKYDKTQLGKYEFEYLFENNRLAIFYFTIIKRNAPTPTLPPVTTTPIPTSISIKEEDIHYGKWVKPSQGSCYSSGGEYDDKKNDCRANWENANIICQAIGGKLPNIEILRTVVRNCGGDLVIGNTMVSEDESVASEDDTLRVAKNITNESYQSCYKERGFNSKAFYWSSTTNVSSMSSARGMMFYLGTDVFNTKSAEVYVRCVGGETAIPPVVVTPTPTPIKEEDVQYDKWIKPSKSNCESGGGTYKNECEANWENANSICQAMGAKLPNREKLKSVVTNCGGISNEANIENNIDNKSYQACYREKGFTSAFSNYWSSTTVASDTKYAWGVFFFYGNEYWYLKASEYAVMCE